MGIVELADLCGLAARGIGGWESVGPQPTLREEDLTEFFGISALGNLPAEGDLERKIPIRRAWVAARARMIETPKTDGGKKGRGMFGF